MAEAPQIHGMLLARNTLPNPMGQVIPLLLGLATIPYIVRGLGTKRFGGSRDRLGGLGLLQPFRPRLGTRQDKIRGGMPGPRRAKAAAGPRLDFARVSARLRCRRRGV